MRKRIYLVLFVILMIGLLALQCFAADTISDPELGVSERESNNTLFSRLSEFWDEYHSVIVSILADAATVVSIIYLLLKNFKKSNAKIDKTQLQSAAVYNSQLKLDGSNKLVETVASQIAQSSQSMEMFVLTEKEKAYPRVHLFKKY